MEHLIEENKLLKSQLSERDLEFALIKTCFGQNINYIKDTLNGLKHSLSVSEEHNKKLNNDLTKVNGSLAGYLYDLVRLRDELNEKGEEYVKVTKRLEQIQNKLKSTFIKELECTICHEIVKSPETLNCSHTFCSGCINTWKETERECPTCRKRILQQVPNLALKNIIKSFQGEIP